MIVDRHTKIDRSKAANVDSTAGENPFSQQRIERLQYRFPDGADWTSNLDRLKQLNFRALIVGDYGTGKSTLIRELQTRLSGEKSLDRPSLDRPITEPFSTRNVANESFDELIHSAMLLDVPRVNAKDLTPSGWLVSCRGEQRKLIATQLSGLDSGTLLLVDGIERLTWLDRQRLVHRTASSSRVAGLIVIVHHRRNWLRLPTWIETRPTETLLNALIDELLAEQPATLRSLIHRRAGELFSQHRHNIRATLRKLFDEWPEIKLSLE